MQRAKNIFFFKANSREERILNSHILVNFLLYNKIRIAGSRLVKIRQALLPCVLVRAFSLSESSGGTGHHIVKISVCFCV